MDEHGAVRLGGQVTNPGGTERLHEYWVHGEGAAKIAWGSPGDFDRCVAELGKYIKDPQGYCNLAHHAALGIYPATHAADIRKAAGRAAMADAKPYGDVKYADPKNGKYPVDTAAHAKAAWSFINQAKNAAQYPMNGVTLSEVKDRIMAACKHFGIDVDDGDSASRAAEQGPVPFVRSYPLEDISIRAGGDGRTVDAYAAVFDTPAPIHDADGDYIEVIDRRAFDRILTKIAPAGGRSNWRCGVFYNHGMTLHGTPSGEGSYPVGVPLEIKADDHGLFTRTRYHKGPEVDRILEGIREGSLSSYSFSGRFDRSVPASRRGGFRPDSRGNLPTVRRTESTLREYGPTPFPAYADAAITGIRSEHIVEQLEHITELLRMGAPLDSPEEDELVSAAPEERGSAPGDSPRQRRSDRSIREQILANTALLLQQQHRR